MMHLAEQLLEESGEDFRKYRVPEIEKSRDLTGVVFKLPFTRRRFRPRPPELCIYGDEDLTGYFFDGSDFQDQTIFGIEGPKKAEKLDTGDYHGFEISPFLGRHDSMSNGFRHYILPVNDRYSHEVIADIRPDEERDSEKLIVNSYNGDSLESQLLIGRTDDNWTCISSNPQELYDQVKNSKNSNF